MKSDTKPRRNQVALTGKVGRLPFKVREELNRRLFEGEDAAALLAWLNSLPEVQNVLVASFKGRPVELPHLQSWQQTSHYQAWTERRQRLLSPLAHAEKAGNLRGIGAQFAQVAQQLGAVVAEAVAARGGVAEVAPLRVDRAEARKGGPFLSLVVDGLPAELPTPDFLLLARGVVIIRGGPALPGVTVQLPRQLAKVLPDATSDVVVLELARRCLYRGAIHRKFALGLYEVPSREEAEEARWKIVPRRESIQPKGETSW